MKYIYILREALVCFITIFWIYQMGISICSLIKFKEKPLKYNKNHKFMAIIPAHNEASVIKNLVESLVALDYPKDLYDVYVIADNCTDNTAEIAREAGALVYERFDEAHKTKGYALEYLFLGLFVAVLGIFMILMNFTVVGVVFIILGFIGILDAHKSTLIVSLNSNDHIVISFVRFDRKKADQAYEMINSAISERVSDTNVKRQTDRVIEAIQNDE